VHRNAGCDNEQSALEELAIAGVSCSVKDYFGNPFAQDAVPVVEAVLETTAGYKAVPHSLLVIPPAAALSGHAAAPSPSPVMRQPVTWTPQTSLTFTKSVWPDAAAVLNATVQSSVWQKQQELQPCPLLVILASPNAIVRSCHWQQLHDQQVQQQ
jgi:hypothetical protein